jgi:hypothetical protein
MRAQQKSTNDQAIAPSCRQYLILAVTDRADVAAPSSDFAIFG